MTLHALTIAACLSIAGTGSGLPAVPGEPDASTHERIDTALLHIELNSNGTGHRPLPSQHGAQLRYQSLASHKLLKYFALEARIAGLGENRKEDGFDPIQSEFATYTGNAIGILPFGDSGIEVFGQLGAGLIANRMDSAFASNQISSTVSTFGLGFRYSRSKHSPLSLTAGYDAFYFQTARDREEQSDQRLSQASLGLNYDF